MLSNPFEFPASACPPVRGRCSPTDFTISARLLSVFVLLGLAIRLLSVFVLLGLAISLVFVVSSILVSLVFVVFVDYYIVAYFFPLVTIAWQRDDLSLTGRLALIGGLQGVEICCCLSPASLEGKIHCV